MQWQAVSGSKRPSSLSRVQRAVRVTIYVGARTRVRFRVPPSRDKWPKRWTLGQKRGHLFRLPNGIAPFSILLPHEFMPARHTTRGVRFRLWFDDLHHSFRYATPNAVRQFPLQDGIHRKTQVPDQQQMWDALALSLDSVVEQGAGRLVASMISLALMYCSSGSAASEGLGSPSAFGG